MSNLPQLLGRLLLRPPCSTPLQAAGSQVLNAFSTSGISGSGLDAALTSRSRSMPCGGTWQLRDLASQSFSITEAPNPSMLALPASPSSYLRTERGPLSFASRRGPLKVQYPYALPKALTPREAVVWSLESLQPSGVISLPGSAFNVPVRVDILHRAVCYLRAKWQQGTHKTKTRPEVSGGGIKPRPQKKTGRSRQGSIRSPIWVGGGAVHGPRPRSHAHKLPLAVQRLGMRTALSARLNEGRMFVVNSLMSPPIKDYVDLKARVETLTDNSKGGTWLLVDSAADDMAQSARLRKQLKCSVRMEALHVEQLTVYHVLQYPRLVLTRSAAEALAAKLTAPHRVTAPAKQAWFVTQRVAVGDAMQQLQAGL